MMPPITDVVKHLLIINIIMFIGTMMIFGESTERYVLAMFYPESGGLFKPYQIVSHMFMHANGSHLFFNMFGLYMFGPPLEIRWGSKKFLSYYLLTGFGALVLYLIVKYIEMTYLGVPRNEVLGTPMLGASGAIFGLLLGFGMTYPNQIIQLLIPPIPMKAKYFVLAYAGIELFLGFGNFNTGVAHFAHLGGALTGFLLILFWRMQGQR